MARNSTGDGAGARGRTEEAAMQLKSTYAGGPGCWHGAIRVGRRTIWTCPHKHRNRDLSSTIAGPSAMACAHAVRLAVEAPAEAERMRDWLGTFGSRGDYDLYDWAVNIAPTIRSRLTATAPEVRP